MKPLFHELGHITDANHREGVTSKQALQSSSLNFGRFYEWTNTVFERLISGKKFYKKDDAMILVPSGYEALAPLGSMLSCALGISEVEFSKIKDQGKEYEDHLLEKIFPMSDDTKALHGADVLEKAKKIFDKYELDSYLSLGKKMTNQNLLNEMYSECLEIMRKRIEIDINNYTIENMEEYKKQQKFFLKKINCNYIYGSKKDGFIFMKKPILHSIEFCDDNLSKEDFEKIASVQVAMSDFGFDNNSIEKYTKTMTESNKNKKSFLDSLYVKISKPKTTEKKSINSEEKTQNYDKEKI